MIKDESEKISAMSAASPRSDAKRPREEQATAAKKKGRHETSVIAAAERNQAHKDLDDASSHEASSDTDNEEYGSFTEPLHDAEDENERIEILCSEFLIPNFPDHRVIDDGQGIVFRTTAMEAYHAAMNKALLLIHERIGQQDRKSSREKGRQGLATGIDPDLAAFLRGHTEASQKQIRVLEAMLESQTKRLESPPKSRLQLELEKHLGSESALPEHVHWDNVRLLKEAWWWPLYVSEEHALIEHFIVDKGAPGPRMVAIRHYMEHQWSVLPEETVRPALQTLQGILMNLALMMGSTATADADKRVAMVESRVNEARIIINTLDAHLISREKGFKAGDVFLTTNTTLSAENFAPSQLEGIKKANFVRNNDSSGGSGGGVGHFRHQNRFEPRTQKMRCGKCSEMIGPNGFKAHNAVCKGKKRH